MNRSRLQKVTVGAELNVDRDGSPTIEARDLTAALNIPGHNFTELGCCSQNVPVGIEASILDPSPLCFELDPLTSARNIPKVRDAVPAARD